MRPQQLTEAVHVLYVDGEPPPAALSDDGRVEVEAVPTAAAARSHLADGTVEVDCVVSEYELPESDGLSLLETVRECYPNLPFVLFTESGSEALASEALGKGVTDYLPKSACGEELCERVGRAVASNSVETESGLTGDRMRELTNAFPDVAFIIDETGRYLEVLSGPATDDLRTVQQQQLVGKRLHDAFDAEQADRFLDHIHTTLESGGVQTLEYEVETEAGRQWFEGRTAPLGREIDGRRAVVWVARDTTERRNNEQRLAARRDELGTLNRINGLINSILQSLVGSATRDEIERTVCEELADSEFYQFAWIGGPWVKDERTNPNTIAGTDRDIVERLVEATSARTEGNSLAEVVSDGETVVVPDVANSDRLSDHERDLMFELDMTSAVLLPLTYGDTNYGVLGISGACSGVSADRERTALETLAEIVAFAINAVKNRNLLLSDTAVELEFVVRGADSVFGGISTDLGCRFELEGMVPVSDDRLLEFVSVEDASPSTVAERLEASEQASECRVVSEDEGLLEVVLRKSGVKRLVTAGTVVKSATADDGEVRYVAEAPSDVDVRSVVDDFRRSYPDSELASKQEVNRPVHTAQEFRQTLSEDLTDRQETALRAAYLAGYYEYPRESTGEDVAESLGISSPTLHQHLRAAQRKLVGTFIDS